MNESVKQQEKTHYTPHKSRKKKVASVRRNMARTTNSESVNLSNAETLSLAKLSRVKTALDVIECEVDVTDRCDYTGLNTHNQHSVHKSDTD